MESLLKLSLIGAGGFTGAVLRFLVSSWVQGRSGSIIFPFGTLSVNMLGCLLIGFLTALVEMKSMFSPETRSFLLIGLLGAFTTFSTFGNETLNLIRESRMELALLNAGGQIIFGVFLVWVGRLLAGLL
ncbi:MAG: fluoride efflux transporter CrcB [Candidatus Electrothrix aestuarii]|uniref:Fluoride-specific ion channel FluC n=1 Tax=Candidatus Electrothrix aestuarii TaxID=3062594 RepID=A0AAU8LQL8_9BACT|nr:fluoride efflux transporter CrcB [Candidatus Electrothrix aestuarii]WPD24894.1 MAG: fluoride efflux transporter CrcB [Candidatus Electrothrix sp. GW3-3]